MNADVKDDLPNILKIDTDASETGETPGVRIWFENGAKIQVIKDEFGGVERQWFDPEHLSKPENAQVVNDATNPEVSLAKVGLETVADYLTFEDEAEARENWDNEPVDILLGK